MIGLGKPTETKLSVDIHFSFTTKNELGRSITTEAKKEGPQKKLTSARASYRDFAWFSALFYIISYILKVRVCMTHVCHSTCIDVCVWENMKLHLCIHRSILVYDMKFNTRYLYMCIQYVHIHTYITHTRESSKRNYYIISPRVIIKAIIITCIYIYLHIHILSWYIHICRIIHIKLLSFS